MLHRVLCGAALMALLGAPVAWAQDDPDPTPWPVNPKYDFWVTPPGGTQSHVDIPAGFFGPGSDAWSGEIALISAPFGPGAGAGKPAHADTSMRRNRHPDVPGDGDTDTVRLRMHGLSLRSAAPITVTYNGGSSPEGWNVKVGLSDLVAQPDGYLTATREGANGGSFDSYFEVYPKFTFTRRDGARTAVLDSGDPAVGGGGSAMQQSGGSWVDNLSGAPSGGFHPGYSDGGCGNPTCIHPAVLYYLLWVLNNCAEHEVQPCTSCPPPIVVDPIEEIEHEALPIGEEEIEIAVTETGHGGTDGSSAVGDTRTPLVGTKGTRVGP